MRRFQLGDRVWVKTPTKAMERRVATITAVRNGGKTVLYSLEWEIDLAEEKDNNNRGYLGHEIALAHR